MVKENSLEKGLQDGWTRATFVLRKDYLSKLKAVSYWDRKKMKEVIDEALGSYLKGKKKLKERKKLAKKMGYSGRKLVERGSGPKTKEAKATIKQVEKEAAPAVKKVAEVVKPKVEIPEVPGAIKVRPQKETRRDLEEAIRGGQPEPFPALEEAIRAPKEGSALEEAIRAPKPELTPEQRIEAIRSKMGPQPAPVVPPKPVVPKPELTPEQKIAAIGEKMVNYPEGEMPAGPPVTIQTGPPGMTDWQVRRKEFLRKKKEKRPIENKEKRAQAVQEYDESLNKIRNDPPFPGATEEELRNMADPYGGPMPERFKFEPNHPRPKPTGDPKMDEINERFWRIGENRYERDFDSKTRAQLRQMEWDKTPEKDRPKLLKKYNAEDRAIAKEEKEIMMGAGSTSTKGMEAFGLDPHNPDDVETWMQRKNAFTAAGGAIAKLRGDILAQLKAGVPNPKTASEVFNFPIKERNSWNPRADIYEERVKKQYINSLVEKGDLDEQYRQKITKKPPAKRWGGGKGGAYKGGAPVGISFEDLKKVGKEMKEHPLPATNWAERIKKLKETLAAEDKGIRRHHLPFEASEVAPTLGAERRGVFGKVLEPFRFGGESGMIHFPTLEDIRNAAENIVKTVKNIDIREAYGLAKNLLSSLPLMSPPIIILVHILI